MRLVARGMLFGVAACWIAWFGNCAVAAPPETSQATSGTADFRFYSLFNGRDLQNWQQAGRWKTAEAAFYSDPPAPVVRREVARGITQIIESDQGDPDLHYVAARLPADCELVFQWKESGQRRRIVPSTHASKSTTTARPILARASITTSLGSRFVCTHAAQEPRRSILGTLDISRLATSSGIFGSCRPVE